MGEQAAGALGVGLEARLEAAQPPPSRPANLTAELKLTGDMASYAWGIDGKAWGAHDPVSPKLGDRVHLTFRNRTMMSHPMHLHGHHFQVIAIDGRPMAGAMRDTVLVPANGGAVTIAFDADNPGRWVMHCHNLYHMLGGMMTEVRYGA
jgi:FtsP/CotA-like multicopper oxidase with cupredoxin domain